MDGYGPGVALLVMGMVAVLVIGLGAAWLWDIVTGWQDRRH
jgi:hypothetical protein